MSLLSSLPQNRILISRFLFVPLLAYIVFVVPPWDQEGYADLLLESLGYICLVAATLGRIWCLSYVGGYKTGDLIAVGPYSVVRNPLYVCNFLGGVGFGLSTEHPDAALAIALVFILYYPLVVAREEQRLVQVHGQKFIDYMRTTPRWIPRFSQFVEPECYLVKPVFIRRSMLGSMWFLWFFMAWEIVERLRELGVIPVYHWM